MTNRRRLLLIGMVALAAIPTIAALGLAGSAGDGRATPPIALAPSSLAPVHEALDAAMTAQGITPPEWVFAGSQSLVAQLEDGAPADIVITADEISFIAARAAGAPQTEAPAERFFAEFARNHLVLAVADGNPGSVNGFDALADDNLLIGLCADTVPCGRLAVEALTRIGIDPRVDTEESSARALTTKLSSGELDAGLVYRSDALAADLQTVSAEALERFTNSYWGTANDAGIAILRFLTTDQAQAVLAEAGFLP